MTDWECCDKILSYLDAHKGESLNVEQIKDKILPDEELDDIESLVESIMSVRSTRPLINLEDYKGGGIKATSFTKQFLDEGGFVAVNRNETHEKKQREESIKNERTKLKYEAATAKWLYYTYWITFAFSIIALILSIIALSMKSQ